MEELLSIIEKFHDKGWYTDLYYSSTVFSLAIENQFDNYSWDNIEEFLKEYRNWL